VKRRFRLTRSNDIQRVRRVGKSYAHPLLVLVVASAPTVPAALPQGELSQRALSQVAIITSHRIGIAVQRNHIRRQIRACWDKLLPNLPDGWHLVVLARQPIVRADFVEIERALKSVIRRAGLTVEVKAEDGRNS
jgi:ribonuclease P protein component